VSREIEGSDPADPPVLLRLAEMRSSIVMRNAAPTPISLQSTTSPIRAVP
jgi:hypothetical protein